MPIAIQAKKGFITLGICASVSLAGYGLCYLIRMPAVTIDRLVPSTLTTNASGPAFGLFLTVFILLYAFAFFPVTVQFTIREIKTAPWAIITAGSCLLVSLILEIVNNLPALAVAVYPVKMASISPEVLIHFKQVETLHYLALDVAGFSLAYAAIFVYAFVYRKSNKLLAVTILVSLATLLASIITLWFAPRAALLLLVISVFAYVPVPVWMAKKAVARPATIGLIS
jgi:hypothetical protein